jgi:Rieske Fe-S protein
MDRRSALSALTAVASAAAAALLLLPAFAYVLSPLRRRVGDHEWADLGPVELLPEGVPALVSYQIAIADGWSRRAQSFSAWVTRRGDDFRVFTSICPHLGCAVRFNREQGAFSCPCHASAFAADGRRLSGPSRRDLDPLAFRLERGRLLVRHAAYRAGIPGRVPA